DRFRSVARPDGDVGVVRGQLGNGGASRFAGGLHAVKASPKSVTGYIASQPAATRTILARVRSAIRKAMPRAEEVLSYNIPTYKLDGRAILYFAGWKQHYSLYPASKRMLEEFATDLAPYEVEKGTIRFPLTRPVPSKLIERIA